MFSIKKVILHNHVLPPLVATIYRYTTQPYIRLTKVQVEHIHNTLIINKTDSCSIQLLFHNTISDGVEYVTSCHIIIVRMSSDI